MEQSPGKIRVKAARGAALEHRREFVGARRVASRTGGWGFVSPEGQGFVRVIASASDCVDIIFDFVPQHRRLGADAGHATVNTTGNGRRNTRSGNAGPATFSGRRDARREHPGA
jgi:hypothetical protein